MAATNDVPIVYNIDTMKRRWKKEQLLFLFVHIEHIVQNDCSLNFRYPQPQNAHFN